MHNTSSDSDSVWHSLQEPLVLAKALVLFLKLCIYLLQESYTSIQMRKGITNRLHFCCQFIYIYIYLYFEFNESHIQSILYNWLGIRTGRESGESGVRGGTLSGRGRHWITVKREIRNEFFSSDLSGKVIVITIVCFDWT